MWGNIQSTVIFSTVQVETFSKPLAGIIEQSSSTNDTVFRLHGSRNQRLEKSSYQKNSFLNKLCSKLLVSDEAFRWVKSKTLVHPNRFEFFANSLSVSTPTSLIPSSRAISISISARRAPASTPSASTGTCDRSGKTPYHLPHLTSLCLYLGHRPV